MGVGMKAVLAPNPILFFGDEAGFDAQMKANTDWFEKIATEGKGRVYPSMIPHSAYMCPEAQLRKAKSAYDSAGSKLNYTIHTHCNETKKEITDLEEKDWNTTKKGSVQVFDDLGMLTDRTVLAHCVHMTDEEIALLSKRGASVAHNPRSNLKLGSGIAEVAKMIKAGVNVCLGTDGAASNNTLDMLTEMQYASMLAKGHLRPDCRPSTRSTSYGNDLRSEGFGTCR